MGGETRKDLQMSLPKDRNNVNSCLYGTYGCRFLFLREREDI